MITMAWHIRGQREEYSTEGEALAAAWAMTEPGAARPEVYELSIPPPPGADKAWVRFEKPRIMGRDEDNRTIITINAWGLLDDMPAHIATLPFDSEQWRDEILTRMKAFARTEIRRDEKRASVVVWAEQDSFDYGVAITTWRARATLALAWLRDD